MEPAHAAPGPRGALAAVLAACLLGASGCSYVNPQGTSRQTPAVPGIQARIGPLQLRDLLIVSSGHSPGSPTPSPDAPGRLLGTLFNTSAAKATLTLSAPSSNTIEVAVPAHGHLALGTTPGVPELTRSGAVPGALATLTATAAGTTRQIRVPVLDGTLAQYRPYLPTQPPGNAPVPTAKPPATTPPPPNAAAAS